MITEKEIESVNLSPTKSDFYQIWNELLETAGKLSERWSPESTNESDPGIVLLKVLTAIADKLNYTISKNTLECFMPSAAQEESMKKLCDMLGYDMKYYQSATTDVTISYIGEEKITDQDVFKSSGLPLPAYTNIKNADNDVNYFTLEPIIFDDTTNKTRTVSCMEGEVVLCADDTDNIVTIAQLDENNRYYLPEAQIAENGIFITNINDSVVSDLWTKVTNLNTQVIGTKCFKFGFDSLLKMPYIQFPEDISTIIEDGLIIRYTRTNGANGNISYNTLSTLEAPELWSDETYSEVTSILNVTNFAVKNPSASVNGTDKETINDAYNSYKRTIGTFDTLVTCRDYINKIYQMTTSETDVTPLVSNIVVSDIRDDINKAITLCTFNDSGIAYVDKSLKEKNTSDKISNFDLVLYPFTTISGNISKENYEKSFEFTKANSLEIENELEDYKTISHNIVYPLDNEIVAIKNYLRIKAKITTTIKVNSVEEKLILNNIYLALYKNFNARKVDFGEEIPFDTILEVIQNADTRIKNVVLDEPTLYTKYLFANGNYADSANEDATYNKLALRNVLAGRIELFEYNENFKPEFTEQAYGNGFEPLYPSDTREIRSLEPKFTVTGGNSALTLNENEAIQFRAPNFKTVTTYPSYVNYFIHLDSSHTGESAAPATFGTIGDYMGGSSKFSGEQALNKWIEFVSQRDTAGEFIIPLETISITTQADFNEKKQTYGMIYTTEEPLSGDRQEATWSASVKNYRVFKINNTTYGQLYNYICSKNANYPETGNKEKLKGIFRSLGSDRSRQIGYMVDSNKVKYTYCYNVLSSSSPLTSYYIQITYANDESGTHTKDGFGKNGIAAGIAANCDYVLKPTEWLAINYTPSSTDDDGNTVTNDPVSIVYEAGTIIRPNFELIGSETYRLSHSPTKTSGYNFDDSAKQQVIDNTGGMFTLGTNEQIELRDAVEVVLDEEGTNIYWELNNEVVDDTDKLIHFPFDEESGIAYTLKEGEYLYYTDASKIDLAYYGNGTKIIRSTTSLEITKEKTNAEKLANDIANNGLLAALPWKQYKFSSDSNLTIKEYQYITLTTGDTLNTLGGESSIASINSTFTPVTNNIASYTYAGSTTSESLPKITGFNWEVRSALNLNVSPTNKQTLHHTESGTDITTGIDEVTINFESGMPVILTPAIESGNYIPLTFETNYICQSSLNRFTIDEEITDFKVKVFKYSDVVDSIGTKLDLENFGAGGLTKVSFKNLGTKTFDLNINTLNNTHGLIMFYYIDPSTDIIKHAYITIDNLAPFPLVKICNCNATTSTLFSSDYWWESGTEDSGIATKYHLRNGINIVEITGKCTITVHPGDDTTNTALIFSNLDLVNLDSGNLKANTIIDYKATDSDETINTQILKDIRTIDTDYNFYYNAIIDNSTTIDINASADEKLSSPNIWYDYNNINNKFVISEIDADYLSDGITLANSSRK